MKLFPCRHDWLTLHYTARGWCSGFRKCLNCSREETSLYNFKDEKFEWVNGRYVKEDPTGVQTIYVFAGSSSSFYDTTQTLFNEMPDHKIDFKWVTTEADMEQLSSSRMPPFYLADDWAESPWIEDYRFRTLLMVGHL